MFKGLYYLPAKSISYSSKERKRDDIKYIVVHYTGNETDTAKNNAYFFATGNTREAGAHFFVDENDIYYSIRVKYSAYSVGTKDKKVVAKLFGKCTNYNSISVELCSNKGIFLPETLNNAELLIKQLMYLFNVPSERVVRHYDVTGKKCPGWYGWCDNNNSAWYKFKTRFLKG